MQKLKAGLWKLKTKNFTTLFFTILIIIGCVNNSKNDSIRKFQLQVANRKVIIDFDILSLEIDTIINKKNTMGNSFNKTNVEQT